jgi:hypothetical protein
LQCPDSTSQRRAADEVTAVQAEEELKEKQGKAEGNGETCDAEMNNIQSMREWMKANNKDYYSIYYIDGTEYEVAE